MVFKVGWRQDGAGQAHLQPTRQGGAQLKKGGLGRKKSTVCSWFRHSTASDFIFHQISYGLKSKQDLQAVLLFTFTLSRSKDTQPVSTSAVAAATAPAQYITQLIHAKKIRHSSHSISKMKFPDFPQLCSALFSDTSTEQLLVLHNFQSSPPALHRLLSIIILL